LSYACTGEEFAEFDLTSTYKQVKLEEKIGDFVPDVTLISEKHSPIFIEIVVTHESSEEKIISGSKIIEICITNEEDIQEFHKKHLHTSSQNIRTYGINGKPRSGNICGGNCKKEAKFFVVFHDGNAKILSAPLNSFYERRSNYKILSAAIISDSRDSNFYQDLVANLRHHLFAGASIKNCLLCVEQGIGKYSGIWCRAKSEKISSSDAIKCDSYKPFTSIVEAKAAEKKNLEEHKAHGNELVERMIRGYR